jgi:hypothetical protein
MVAQVGLVNVPRAEPRSEPAPIVVARPVAVALPDAVVPPTVPAPVPA